MQRRRTAQALAALITVSALLPTAVVADQTDFCGDVQLVWARGTDEAPDDVTLQEVDTQLDGRLGAGVTYEKYELGKLGGTGGFNYPAAGSGIPFFLEWAQTDFGPYFDSKEQGIHELDTYLRQRAVECPGELYVLGGWSQGAHVMTEGLFLLPKSVRDRIAFVALFGDPTLQTGFDTVVPAEFAGPFLDACKGNPGPWIRGSAPCWNPGGIFQQVRDEYVPADIATRVGSWCRGGDFACTSLPQVIPTTDVEH